MKKRLFAVLGCGFALGLLGASLAWACTATSTTTVIPEITSPSRQVAVTGTTFQPGPVEIRWNSSEGPVLQTALADSSGKIATELTVPQAVPGVYYVVTTDGRSTARAVVQVTDLTNLPGSKAQVSSSLWDGFDPGTGFQGDELRSGGAQPSDDNAGFLVGMALLGFGLTAIGAGLVTSVLRRRKVHGS